MLTDSHCHLYKEYYEDIDEIIKMSISKNVTKFITCGCNYKSNLETLEIIKKPNVYGAIGVHPTEIDDINKSVELIKANVDNPKIVAIGEIGLDYHYENTNKKEQIEVFNLMLQLAEKYHKPVVVHSRDAFSDTYNILKKYQVKGIIHSFCGTLEEAKKYIDLGFLIGINGIVTFKNSNLLEIVCNIDLNKMVLETDSPYLAPVPYRGTQNNPSHIYDIALFLSDKLNLSMEVFTEQIASNLATIFDLSN